MSLNPNIGGKLFQLCFILCYDFHVVRWGLLHHRTLLRQKWLRVIINKEKYSADKYFLLLLFFLEYRIWQFMQKFPIKYEITHPIFEKNYRAPVTTSFFQPKRIQIFSYSSLKTYFVGTHKKHLSKVLLMSTHNLIMFLRWNKKNILLLPTHLRLSGATIWILYIYCNHDIYIPIHCRWHISRALSELWGRLQCLGHFGSSRGCRPR